MKSILTVAKIGTGTEDDPLRPDVPPQYPCWVVVADHGATMDVLVADDAPGPDAAAPNGADVAEPAG